MTTWEGERRLFGTDGVRDIANRGAMTPESALSFGRAYASFLAGRGVARPKIVTCRDTRISGTMIERALHAGMMSEGAEPHALGIFPTPGVSFVLRQGGFDAGAVISASHNPAEYNGIKFFDARGFKLTDDDEAAVEGFVMGGTLKERPRPTGGDIGSLVEAGDRGRAYVEWLRGMLSAIRGRGFRLTIDAANGAASDIARQVFELWGSDVLYRGADYDGVNINDGVGVMHMGSLTGAVKSSSSRLGMAFDGDADRVLLCDRAGRVIDGDIMLWIIGRCLKSAGALGRGVVATVMSNMALEETLGEHGIEVFRCAVGDRYVLERMRETGSRLGGEQSGHVIASDYVSTGDGICTGLLFLKSCAELGEDIDTLADRFPRYPQLLKSMRVDDREAALSSPMLEEACENARARLSGAGRLFLRPSGTEPLIRILVEARDEALMLAVSRDIEETILKIGQNSRKMLRKR
ncbi:MAG: phosphoglucosamine mutase [Synergistaceae bacterium]|jgi:phosphoglucosamine mutase|nr:phosphoglucosamine mutase [Synergistaceae bacterium]